MSRHWTINDIHTVEKSPTSPSRLQWKISEVLFNSTACRCKVETVNPTRVNTASCCRAPWTAVTKATCRISTANLKTDGGEGSRTVPPLLFHPRRIGLTSCIGLEIG